MTFYIIPFIIVLVTHCMAGAGDSTAAPNYDFTIDISAYEKNTFDYSLFLDIMPSLFFLDDGSALRRLRYPLTTRPLLDAYSLKTEGNLHYHRKGFSTFLSGAAGLVYFRNNDSTAYATKLLESYIKYSPNISFSILSGRKNFKWGKGYIYNPVSFVSRPKDINNTQASLEGYWMGAVEFIKSIAKPLETFAATISLLPVYNEINRGFAENKTLSLASQLYVLLFDTDIDIYTLTHSNGEYSLGFDFSKNLRTNLEVHTDWAFQSAVARHLFRTDSTTALSLKPGVEFLTGVRYLTPFNTTIIFEYFHRNSGYTVQEMQIYRAALEKASGLTISDPLRKKIMHISSAYYSGQFIMRNYFYLKISHPDLLNITYFNPSLYCLLNIDDRSFLAGIELSYIRFKHLSLLQRYVLYRGSGETEYGMKPFDHRLELRLRLML